MLVIPAVIIPLPNVTITNSLNSHYLSGLQLNLTCHIQLPMPIEYKVSVSSQWGKSCSVLTSNSRMSVDEEAVEVGPLLYQSSLVFSSLDRDRDDGNYTCSVTVSPIGISPVTVTASHTISVESKDSFSYITRKISMQACMVRRTFNFFVLTIIVAALIQLRLIGITDCNNWKVL